MPSTYALGQAPLAAGATQTFTAPALSTTPTFALFWCSWATANGTAVSNAVLMVGATDGASNRCVLSANQDGGTEGFRVGTTAACIHIQDPATSAVVAAGAFLSFGTGSVTIAWNTSPTRPVLLNYLLAATSRAAVGTWSAGSTPHVIALGWQPDVILSVSPQGEAMDGSKHTNGSGVAVAFVLRDGSTPPYQVAASRNFVITALGDSIPAASLTEGLILQELTPSANPPFFPSLSQEIRVSAISSTGFSVAQVSPVPNAREGFYLAFRHLTAEDQAAGRPFGSLVLLDSPTALGLAQAAEPGIFPALALLLTTRLLDPNDPVQGANAGAFGLSAFTAARELSASIQVKGFGDNAHDSQSVTDELAVNQPEDDGTTDQGHRLNFQAFNPSGWSWNVLATAPAARSWVALSLLGPGPAGRPDRGIGPVPGGGTGRGGMLGPS